MQTIYWEVNFLSLPRTKHYCKKCGRKTPFVSSDLFRVNAQQKSLDIWLIYKCEHCNTTWNLTIYSRIHPKSISQSLLEKFTQNDLQLARKYAMDFELIKRNGAETEEPLYSIAGEEIPLGHEVRVVIKSPFPSTLRVAKVIREKLSLSRKAFDTLIANNIIRLEKGGDIYKCKLNEDTVVVFKGHPES